MTRPLVILLLSAGILVVFYKLAKTSLEGLKYETKSYFPFEKYFPKYPIWSVLFYLVLLLMLVALLLLFIRGQLPLLYTG